MVGARVRRQQVAYAEGGGLSRRRACALLSVARSTIGYVSKLIARDPDVVPPMTTLAAQYPRDGDRTIRIFLERQRQRPYVPPVPAGGPPGAEETPTPPRGGQPPSAAAAQIGTAFIDPGKP